MYMQYASMYSLANTQLNSVMRHNFLVKYFLCMDVQFRWLSSVHVCCACSKS